MQSRKAPRGAVPARPASRPAPRISSSCRTAWTEAAGSVDGGVRGAVGAESAPHSSRNPCSTSAESVGSGGVERGSAVEDSASSASRSP